VTELESIVRDELAKRRTPGVAVSAVEDGAVSWTLSVGSRGNGLPVEDRTIFEAASMSKPVTA
jgi:CubicO group peptidase (beta-lactamase class C family)